MADNYRRWLANGGDQVLKEAMAKARATSEEFARSTQVRTETLYEPVTF